MRVEDVRVAMSRLDEGLDVLPDDVLAVVREAEAHALDRRLGRMRCGTLMARNVQTVRATDTMFRARMSMTNHHLKALPVVDDGRLAGLITRAELIAVLNKALVGD